MAHELDIGTDNTRSTMIDSKLFEAILKFDTCTIANAIEHFGIRMRNEGFTRPGLSCLTGSDQRILGYAATFRVRSSEPPVVGGIFNDRSDWWCEIEQLPHPTIAVFQNLDPEIEAGSSVGNIHAAILKAFGCCGIITNGSVRDASGIRELGIPVYAASLTISHAYNRIVDFGVPIEIFGLSVHQGDLLYADCHGVLSIPIEIAAELPDVAARILRKEKNILDLCQSANFTSIKLLQAIQENDQFQIE